MKHLIAIFSIIFGIIAMIPMMFTTIDYPLSGNMIIILAIIGVILSIISWKNSKILSLLGMLLNGGVLLFFILLVFALG